MTDLSQGDIETERDKLNELSAPNKTVPMAVEAKPDGLQLIFQTGEMLPLKSIWFEVEKVGLDYMVLKPQTTTAAFRKLKARGQKA